MLNIFVVVPRARRLWSRLCSQQGWSQGQGVRKAAFARHARRRAARSAQYEQNSEGLGRRREARQNKRSQHWNAVAQPYVIQPYWLSTSRNSSVAISGNRRENGLCGVAASRYAGNGWCLLDDEGEFNDCPDIGIHGLIDVRSMRTCIASCTTLPCLREPK